MGFLKRKNKSKMTTKPEQLESLVFKYDRSKSIRELALGRSEDG